MGRKYWKIAHLSWQKGLVYRFNVLYMLVDALLPTIAMFYLWSSIYENGDKISNYTFSQLFTYFVGARLINYLLWYPIDWNLNVAVNEGDLGYILVKPIDVQIYYIWDMIGDRLVNIALGFLPLSIIVVALYSYFDLNLSIVSLVFSIVASFLSALLWFFLSWTLGCYVFWAHQVGMLLFVKEMIVMILAGSYFPIDILPAGIVNIIKLLPFPYLAWFPLTVLLNEFDTAYVIQGLLIQVFWILIFFALGRLVWREGLKKFTDVRG